MGTQEKIAKSFEKLCKHRHNFSLILILSSVSNELHNLLSTLGVVRNISFFFCNPMSPRSLGNDISRLCTEF